MLLSITFIELIPTLIFLLRNIVIVQAIYDFYQNNNCNKYLCFCDNIDHIT